MQPYSNTSNISVSHMINYPKEQICGLILAGGKGRRLGGLDKGLLEKDGLPFVVHIQNLLRPQVNIILINANRNHSTYQQYGEIVADEMHGFQGPLAGMHTAMQACELEWIISVPCDGIVLPDDMVARLYKSCIDSNSLIAVAHDGNRLQPVHAMMHCSLHNSLGAYLKEGYRKIDLWYAQQGYATTDFSDYPQMFNNINTPTDKQKHGAQ